MIHIGTHKTGTTSFQTWAEQHATDLSYFTGMFGPNHYELALACTRLDRNMTPQRRHFDWCVPGWRESVKVHVRAQTSHDLLVSCEDLSLFRYADEIERLQSLFHPLDLEVVVVLRDPVQFLRSYRGQLERMGFPPSPHRESFAYTEDDSWLIDYESLLAVYRDALGNERVHVVEYESAMERFGSTIPAVMEAAGASLDALPDWSEFKLNVTGQRPPQARRSRSSFRKRARRLGRRILRS
jgi:hypothetical protein